eukprot:8323866-Karenia_brevis.AAC.1
MAVVAQRLNIPAAAIFSSEVDEIACHVARVNFPDASHVGDIRSFDDSLIDSICTRFEHALLVLGA